MKEAFCILSFNKLFLNLVLVGIMSFAMFLLVCCILCFNVRHYQHHLHQFKKPRGKAKVHPLDET